MRNSGADSAGLTMSLNGHPIEHHVERLEDRVGRLEHHVSNIELDNKHTAATLNELRTDVKTIHSLVQRAIGAVAALGVIWTLVTFVVATFFRR